MGITRKASMLEKIQPRNSKKIYLDTKYIKFGVIIILILFGLILFHSHSYADKKFKNYYVCKDFTTQVEAQDYFNSNKPNKLDGNSNGIACETLP